MGILALGLHFLLSLCGLLFLRPAADRSACYQSLGICQASLLVAGAHPWLVSVTASPGDALELLPTKPGRTLGKSPLCERAEVTREGWKVLLGLGSGPWNEGSMSEAVAGRGDMKPEEGGSKPGTSQELLQRLRELEAENSALAQANENQRETYERCLDEVANHVVQALLNQKPSTNGLALERARPHACGILMEQTQNELQVMYQEVTAENFMQQLLNRVDGKEAYESRLEQKRELRDFQRVSHDIKDPRLFRPPRNGIIGDLRSCEETPKKSPDSKVREEIPSDDSLAESVNSQHFTAPPGAQPWGLVPNADPCHDEREGKPGALGLGLAELDPNAISPPHPES
ncbi:Nck-associated protein 5-like protein [Chelonia mydas]|uniref:Nck-associated protein 5-like protein n=1 Tax=Chelonia mydas TaxID=8469 RepID=M7B2E0_CHEMY|nr:Nck-associated protein 5-like protein [Chelonia mydas]